MINSLLALSRGLLKSEKRIYDSQSGRYVKAPPKGVRLHLGRDLDISILTSWSLPSSLQLTLGADTKRFSPKNVPLFAQLANLADAQSLISYSQGFDGVCLEVNTKVDKEMVWKRTTQKLKENSSLIVQAVYPIDFANFDVFEEASFIASIADVGVDQIFVVPCTAYSPPDIDEYLIHSLIEECIGTDIEGDSMAERLGVHASLAIAAVALDAGITRLLVTGSYPAVASDALSLEQAEGLVLSRGRRVVQDSSKG